MDEERGSNWPKALLIALPVALLAGAAVVFLLVSGGDDGEEAATEADAQTIEFQEPTDPGPDPFTGETDVSGSTTVSFETDAEAPPPDAPSGSVPSSGAGTFGGSGSDYVCDREKLIRELQARPEIMRAWAEVHGLEPDPEVVADYIRGLRPVTLTQDTQVTNHSYSDGVAHPFQAILAKGTAVLVDAKGTPVVRCRCGNPLRPPIYYKQATCYHCPPNYKPPPPCRYRPYDDYDQDYGGYEEQTYAGYQEPDGYEALKQYSDCYVYYPAPPPVREPVTEASTTPAPESEPEDGGTYYVEPDYDEGTTTTHTETYTEPEYTEPEYTEPTYTEPTTTHTTP